MKDTFFLPTKKSLKLNMYQDTMCKIKKIHCVKNIKLILLANGMVPVVV